MVPLGVPHLTGFNNVRIGFKSPVPTHLDGQDSSLPQECSLVRRRLQTGDYVEQSLLHPPTDNPKSLFTSTINSVHLDNVKHLLPQTTHSSWPAARSI
jgi:hypothetical protein